VAGPGTEILDLVGPLQVFARAAEMFGKQNPGSPPIYSVEVITTSAHRSFVANCGLRITAHKTFREVRGKIDTLLIAGGNAIEQDEINPDVIRWLRKMAGRTRRIGSVCTGAMLLARAGLLDGRRATTHWNWCHILIKRAPRADVDPDPIFIRDENVYTSAGVTAGMDLALALVEEDYGSGLALQVARNQATLAELAYQSQQARVEDLKRGVSPAAAEEARAAGNEQHAGLDWYGFTLSFKGVLLEGLEVAFIVVTFGSTQGNVGLAALGAGIALAMVAVVGVVVRGPLTRVPENTMKFAVGTMLTTFGIFWAAEGAGAHWPGDDASLPAVLAFVVALSSAAVAMLKRRRMAFA